MDEPPYLVIAAELRRRIETGELQPGERVPSTRSLVRDFGVAMATATKALRALQDERLVHASPGVGTIVGAPPRTTRARPVPAALNEPRSGLALALERDQVVRMGIAIADAEGLPAVSMRRIAAELGVSTMALYRHVGGKETLVLQMVDAAFGEFPLPTLYGDWRARVTVVAQTQWAAYRAHLWLAGAVSVGRPQVLPHLLPHTDALLSAFKPLDKTTAMYAVISVFGYVRSLAQAMETEAQAVQDTGLTADDWAERQTEQMAAVIAAGNLTAFRDLMADDWDFDYDLDRLFAFGLDLMLDGLAVRL
ncbi:GntR family transcriptional regulator [Kribbella albertanoniae]|uniref:GntR family transcriptional regulator n=1 Tax=Kribbella albertanoniae TaxID=1266829 RepID=A0A4R4P8B4_9ACTN|nr:GntR family transcriptional regulator [Kribbella albertanoniae]TDC18054.1 GntR family transcriptional regulator [Kribbella albertanoniae]